jgi:molecular chaperone DnaJ
MPHRNLYFVLGVSRGERPAGIRAAYRHLARKHHPDVAGNYGTAEFQEIAEAYRVLSDPELRRRYDESPRGDERAPPRARRPASQGEPLRAEPVSVMSHPPAVHPSFDAVLDRFLRNFTGRAVPKAERVEGLEFDLVLTPDEAARGGVLPIAVPVFVGCPDCGGSGHEWGFSCLACDGQGVVESEQPVGVRLRPMTPQGTIVEVPLEGLGIHNFRLRLHVHVQG